MNHNTPGHMLTLAQMAIFKPAEGQFRPAQENLIWVYAGG
jgi:hypothetical protein